MTEEEKQVQCIAENMKKNDSVRLAKITITELNPKNKTKSVY